MKIVICTFHVRRSFQSTSLAAGCLTANLPKRLRESTKLIDAFPDQSDQEILHSILAFNPDIVAFPIYMWNRLRTVTLANMLFKERPSVTLIAGGPEVTGDSTRLAKQAPWAALVKGEGELIFSALLKNLLLGCPDTEIPQASLKREEGVLSVTPSTPCEMNRVASPWLSGVIEPTAGVLWEVARGCAFSCDYCFESRGHLGVQALPKKRLEDELELFVAKGVSQIWVLDSTFNYPPERGHDLLEMLLLKAPNIHYHLEAKADFIDRHTVSLLSKLNCSIQIGVQSVHAHVLKTIHRPIDLNVLAEKIHLLEAEGIIFGFDLIYGLPEDTLEGFCQSINSILSFGPNHVHIFPLSVLPGTRLAHHRNRYGIKAQENPPYEMISSNHWTKEDMYRCRSLAASVDLFYNTGRAVAFFPAIVKTLNLQPCDLFEKFFFWALEQPDIDYERFLNSACWTAEDVYRLAQGFISDQLRQSGQSHLTSIFLDLLCYHFNYAETLLGEELLPLPDRDVPTQNLWETPFERSRKLRLVPFAYEILDLLEMDEMHVEEIANLFRPVGSVALFMRRGNHVYCESLGEDMLHLLRHSDGRTSPKNIFAGSISQETGKELVQFAVSEGLIKPTTH